MQINVILTDREKEFLKALVEKGSRYNYSDLYDQFRQDWNDEIRVFKDNDFIYHYNRHDYNACVEIGLSHKGKELAENNGISGAKSFLGFEYLRKE